jgi:hypothetical protein
MDCKHPECGFDCSYASAAMLKALLVFVLDPKIRAWLEENDPKALEQALNAIAKPEER